LLIRTEAANHQGAERPVRLLVQRWAAGPSRVDSPVAGSLPVLQREREPVRRPGRREAPSQPVRPEQPGRPEHRAGPTHPGQPGRRAQQQQQAAPGCLA